MEFVVPHALCTLDYEYVYVHETNSTNGKKEKPRSWPKIQDQFRRPNNKNQEPRNFARFGVRLGPDTKIASREHRTVIGKCTRLEEERWLGCFEKPLI